MLAMFSELPIDMEDVQGFEDLLRSCDKEYNGTRPSITPIEYDTHYDADLVSEKGGELMSNSEYCIVGNFRMVQSLMFFADRSTTAKIRAIVLFSRCRSP